MLTLTCLTIWLHWVQAVGGGSGFSGSSGSGFACRVESSFAGCSGSGYAGYNLVAVDWLLLVRVKGASLEASW
jgi:hypothetical protein